MKIHGTAKGGAISKKDFGVAFSSGGGASGYDSGLGTNADFTTVANLTTDNAVTTPSGLGAKSWLSNGSTTTISLTAGQIFPVDSDLTFVCWVHPTTIKSEGIITSSGTGTYYFVVWFQQSGERLEFIVKDGAGNNAGAESDFAWQADTWYMVACTFNATTGQAIGYVFDTTDDSKTKVVDNTNSSCNSVATTDNWKMFGNVGSNCFAGRILSPVIYNEILSSENLDSLFNSGDGATPDTVQKDKIVCYWDSQTGTASIENLAVP